MGDGEVPQSSGSCSVRRPGDRDGALEDGTQGLDTFAVHDQQVASAHHTAAARSQDLGADRPEINRFNTELRALLGDEEFERTAVALREPAHWNS